MLSIVPTPLGNLQDITLRALETLKAADFILCEDTRRTKILLTHFGISQPTVRYNENDDSSVQRCVALVRQGKSCALVSDCGTPCISDPGWKLVRAVAKENLPITSLPGPSAAACALAGAGFTGGAFTFLGFLPRKPGKAAKLITAAYSQKHPVIIYESPFRIVKLLELVAHTLGEDIPVVAAREISKVYEEWLRGSAKQVAAILRTRKKVQGEFVLVIGLPETEQREQEDEYPDLPY